MEVVAKHIESVVVSLRMEGSSARVALESRALRMSLSLQIARSLRPYRRALLFAAFQVALISFLGLSKPWPLNRLIDYVLPRAQPPWPLPSAASPVALLALATVGLIVIDGALGVASVFNNFTTISIGLAMVSDLRSRLYQHLQRLSLSFHSRAPVGDLIYRVTGDRAPSRHWR